MPLKILLCVLLLSSAALTAGCSAADNSNPGANASNTNTANSASTTPGTANTGTANTNAATTGASKGRPANSNANRNSTGGAYNTGGGGAGSYNSPSPDYQTSPALPTPASRDESVDAYLKSLPLGEVAFNTPETMRLDQTINLEVKLGGPNLVGQLEGLIKEEGQVESHAVKIGNVMEAHLAGVGFEIVPITPSEQPISQTAPTEWEWQVKAIREGKQRLHLTLTVVVFVDGKERRRKIETFKKDILVEVTSGSRIAAFFSDNVSWIVPALIIPFVGGLGLRLRRVLRRRDNPPAQ